MTVQSSGLVVVVSRQPISQEAAKRNEDRWIVWKNRHSTIGNLKLRTNSWNFLLSNVSPDGTILDYTSTPTLAAAVIRSGRHFLTYKKEYKKIKDGFVDWVKNNPLKANIKLLKAIDPVCIFSSYHNLIHCRLNKLRKRSPWLQLRS